MQYAHPQNSAFACTPCATNPPEVFRASGVVPSHPVLRASFSHTAEAAVIPHAIPRMENSGSSVDAPQSTVTTFAGPRAVHGPVVARTLTPAHAPQSLRGNIPSPLPGVDRHCLPWPHGRVNANSMKNTFEDTMQSSWPRVQGHRSRSEGGSNRGQGRGQGTPRPGEKEEASSVAFDWHLVPRGCGAGELASWGGFRGFPGDVARAVILELHPFTDVGFVAKGMGPKITGSGGRTHHHGYQVHTCPYGVAWAVLEVDEQGCVV
ncbi:unnamed protein product [Discosporangium mesarthrocarpum]